MAKLVDLLAKHLKEWPEGAEYARQGFGGYIYDQEKRKLFFIKEFASDAAFATVTKPQYLAARDRLHAETVKDMHVSGVLEAQEFDADQALWDKVAIACYAQNVQCNRGRAGAAICAFDDADAFMAERAKRLKGGE